MNASEKQGLDAPAQDTATKTRAKQRARASKPTAKSVGRAGKPKRPSKAAPVRPGTQTAKILALLQRPGGASLPELRKATGWQPHSVRGFLSGTLKKKMGLHLDSVQRDNGEHAYRVASK